MIITSTTQGCHKNKIYKRSSEVAQLCPTLCNAMDCSLPGSSNPWDFPGENTGVGCHFPLQGIFPAQGSNPGLPHCRQTLYRLSRQGSHLTEVKPSPKQTHSECSFSVAEAVRRGNETVLDFTRAPYIF